MRLTANDTIEILRLAGLEDMDEDLFELEEHGHDENGAPFGVIADSDDGTVLHHFGRGLGGAWMVW